MGPVERRGSIHRVGVPDRLRDLDLALLADLLADEGHREQRCQVIGSDGLPGARMQSAAAAASAGRRRCCTRRVGSGPRAGCTSSACPRWCLLACGAPDGALDAQSIGHPPLHRGRRPGRPDAHSSRRPNATTPTSNARPRPHDRPQQAGQRQGQQGEERVRGEPPRVEAPRKQLGERRFQRMHHAPPQQVRGHRHPQQVQAGHQRLRSQQPCRRREDPTEPAHAEADHADGTRRDGRQAGAEGECEGERGEGLAGQAAHGNDRVRRQVPRDVRHRADGQRAGRDGVGRGHEAQPDPAADDQVAATDGSREHRERGARFHVPGDGRRGQERGRHGQHEAEHEGDEHQDL